MSEEIKETVTIERTVTTESLKDLLEGSADTGHPVTGHIGRDGDTFEDKELGKKWDASYDSTKELIKRVKDA